MSDAESLKIDKIQGKLDLNGKEITEDLEKEIKINLPSVKEFTKRPKFSKKTFQQLIDEGLVKQAEILDISGENNEEGKGSNIINVRVPIKYVLPTDNIRTLSVAHAYELGQDITTTEQLAPCIGDLKGKANKNKQGSTLDKEIRIQAGLHRYWGIANATNWEGLINIALRTYSMSPEEILDIKVRENLHLKMETEEKFTVIGKLYEIYCKTTKNPTQKEFAERYKHSPSLISRAVRFHHLPKELKEYVKRGRFTASQILIFSRLQDPNKMIREATYAITNKLSMEKINERIENTLNEKFDFGLFDPEFYEKQLLVGMEQKLELTVTDEANRASVYFKNLIDTMKILEKNNKLDLLIIGEGTKRQLARFVVNAAYFLKDFKDQIPEVHREIVEKSLQELVRIVDIYKMLETLNDSVISLEEKYLRFSQRERRRLTNFDSSRMKRNLRKATAKRRNSFSQGSLDFE
jgi:hypothetical protein